VVKLEDILSDLEASGYTVVAILPGDNPYERKVVIQDANGTKTTKTYVLNGFTETTDASGNTTVEEDWVEVS